MNFQKYYCYLYEDKGEYQNRAEEYLILKNLHPELKFVFLVDKENVTSDDKIKEVLSIIKNFVNEGISPQDLTISVEGFEHKYKTAEWNKVLEFENVLKQKNITFGFEDMHRTWSTKEVEVANSKIVDTANEIKKKKLSSFETLLDAYLKVSDRKYVHETENEHFSQSRSVFGVLNSDKVVCVGFAEMLSAIIKEIGDENIKIYLNNVATSDDNKTRRGFHENVIVYIKDENYGIDGYYYLDPTWDASKGNIMSLKYFMIPLGDIGKFRQPYIRRADKLYPPKEELLRNTIKSDKEDLIYNARANNNVSFTSDGFRYSYSFMRDYLTLFPEEAEKFKKMVGSEELDRLEKNYYKFERKKKIFEQIKKEFNGLNRTISEQDSISLYSAINNIINTEKVDKIERLKQSVENGPDFNEGVSITNLLDRQEKALEEGQTEVLYEIAVKEDEPIEPVILAYNLINISKENRMVDKVLLENSRPIETEIYMTALKKVLKTDYPQLNDAQIDSLVHKIIINMADRRKVVFSGFNETSLASYLDGMDIIKDKE